MSNNVEFQSVGLPSYENLPIAELVPFEPLPTYDEAIGKPNELPNALPVLSPPVLPNPSAPILPNAVNATDKMSRFGEVVDKYKISNTYALKMRQLENYDITVICDDSSSMSSPVKSPTNPFEHVDTRWTEAQKSLKIIVDIASIFDADGVDIYYLNRKPIKRIVSGEYLETKKNFHDSPSGSTPLGKVLAQVLNEKSTVIREKPMLLIIFTDGRPDDMGSFIDNLKKCSQTERIMINIVACTDDEHAVGYLNGLDRKIKHLDVCDDYHSEMTQIQKVQGKNFAFTFGDYITKILLGPIDREIDELDEMPVRSGRKRKSMCNIM